MTDSRRYQDWFEKVKIDFRAADILLACGGDGSIIAFHCQQAIEKALKGYLLKHTGELNEGHSLRYLCKKVAKVDSYYDQYLKDCTYIGQFYLDTRYPGDAPTTVGKEEADDCLGTTERIVSSLIGEPLPRYEPERPRLQDELDLDL